uniref:C1q domain-containing protein n=1 Tax=Magallana gigas TaxID=29159 RepID=A0A8W8M0I7_MAGGI
SFVWSFLSKKGGTVYIAAVVDNVDHVHTCINNLQSQYMYISTSGHLIYELKKDTTVWIRTFYTQVTLIQGGLRTYFSGSKISFM